MLRSDNVQTTRAQPIHCDIVPFIRKSGYEIVFRYNFSVSIQSHLNLSSDPFLLAANVPSFYFSHNSSASNFFLGRKILYVGCAWADLYIKYRIANDLIKSTIFLLFLTLRHLGYNAGLQWQHANSWQVWKENRWKMPPCRISSLILLAHRPPGTHHIEQYVVRDNVKKAIFL